MLQKEGHSLQDFAPGWVDNCTASPDLSHIGLYSANGRILRNLKDHQCLKYAMTKLSNIGRCFDFFGRRMYGELNKALKIETIFFNFL